MLVGGVACEAATRTWPFRVYSFPKATRVFPAFDPKIHTYDIGQMSDSAIFKRYIILQQEMYDNWINRPISIVTAKGIRVPINRWKPDIQSIV